MAKEDRTYIAFSKAKSVGFDETTIDEMGFTDRSTWYRFTGTDGKDYFTVENDDGTDGENKTEKRIFVKFADCAKATGNPKFPFGTDCEYGKTKKGDTWYRFLDKKGRKCFSVEYENK